MDFSKLKLEQFTTYNTFNEPIVFEHNILKRSEHPDVLFCFVRSIEETLDVINKVLNINLPCNNRVFFIYPKGNKEFHRDHLYNIIESNNQFIRKAPLLSSLNNDYSVFAYMVHYD